MKTYIWFVKHKSTAKSILLALLIVFTTLYTNAQDSPKIKVSGTVSDNASNELIPGVNILIKGTQTGSVTDINGKYSLEAPIGSTLVFSYIGYENMEVQVGSQQKIDVRLKILVQALDGVVVIGYGSTTKKEVTGSISSIKSDEFNPGAYNSPMGLLQGKVAGLTVIQANGADPMASYSIILRGTNTLTSGQGPLIVIDGVAGTDMKNISPEEVESMDVLKDGSAAAIYGTRGSNGVIIITTKRAKVGAAKVEYSGQFSVQVAPRGVQNLTADEFRSAIELYAPDKAVNIYDANTDWFKEVTRENPFSQKHNLAISGGTDNFSHRTTIYVDQADGLLQKNQSNKYLLRTNISQKVFGDVLLLDYNLSYSNRKYSPANYDVFYQAFIRNPTSAVYDPDNSYSGGYTRLEGIDYYNPVAMLNERTREGKTIDVGGNVRATLNLAKSLKWINFISIEQSDWEDMSYKSKYYPSILGKGGEAEIANGKSSTLLYESTVNYTKSFQKHTIQALAGYSYQEQETNNSYMVNSGFDSDYYGPNNIETGTALGDGIAEMGSYKGSSLLISFFGRLMYNYSERYLASVSLRREGDSKFGENNDWGWFPAASLGWRINKEEFMSNVNWVNELKLRVGYGTTGNQDFGSYQSLMMVGPGKKFYYNGEWIYSWGPTSNANPELRWEKKQEFDAGVDFSLFNNRISGAFDYYYRTSTDLLYSYKVPYPPYLYPLMFANIGTIRNTGIELALNGKVIKGSSFEWNTTVTFSTNNNKLIKFSNDVFTTKYIESGWLGGSFPVFSQRLEEGKSLGTFYGAVWIGMNEDGLDLFKNANPVGKVDPKDWEPIGNAYPFCTIGWSNMFTYSDWDLNFSLRSSIGGQVLNMYRLYYENWQSLGRNIVHTQLENPEFKGIGQYSSKYIESATFVKLDNISLGYNFPIHLKYISKIRLNATAQDVLTITGYKGLDPEVNLGGLEPGIERLSYYPRTTTITLGVNVVF